MKFFCCQGIFFVNFDFKNGCKNEFEDNNEISCSRFKIKAPPLKMDFRADWTNESIPTAWESSKLRIFKSFEFLTLAKVASWLLVQRDQFRIPRSETGFGPSLPLKP